MTGIEDPMWARALEAVTVGMKLKAEMLKAGKTRRTIDCPRCGADLHAGLTGRRNHLRMLCEGKCGMEVME